MKYNKKEGLWAVEARARCCRVGGMKDAIPDWSSWQMLEADSLVALLHQRKMNAINFKASMMHYRELQWREKYGTVKSS